MFENLVFPIKKLNDHFEVLDILNVCLINGYSSYIEKRIKRKLGLKNEK